MACDTLTKWPEEVLKILHCVFCALAVIFLFLAGGWGGNSWLALVFIPMVGAIVILCWFICDDPRQFKLALLIYYIIACILTGVGMILGIINVVNIVKVIGDGHFCRGRGYYEWSRPENVAPRHSRQSGYYDPRIESGCDNIFHHAAFYYLLLAFIFTIGAFVCYVVSAVFNGKKGKP